MDDHTLKSQRQTISPRASISLPAIVQLYFDAYPTSDMYHKTRQLSKQLENQAQLRDKARRELPLFEGHGLIPWLFTSSATLKSPHLDPNDALSNGYSYLTGHRELANEKRGVSFLPEALVKTHGSLSSLGRFRCLNWLKWVFRTKDGHDVVVRVITVKKEGYDHIKVLRTLATGALSFAFDNHTLPMLDEVSFEDITFGIFPRVGSGMLDAFYWASNSAGDIIDMIMQALEALSFIHVQRVAHRDAFVDNFVVQWHPESCLSP
ncbi:hypothetical protein DXG01_008046 [Tephrocybe rancida]|nr:hypothetical protein DXG01_008046 [Tephrocybe rancida]